jgi:hypothetical protein
MDYSELTQPELWALHGKLCSAVLDAEGEYGERVDISEEMEDVAADVCYALVMKMNEDERIDRG